MGDRVLRYLAHRVLWLLGGIVLCVFSAGGTASEDIDTSGVFCCEILIAGSSEGGVAAALAAAENGAHVVLLAEGRWLGGQLSEEGVTALDEHSRIETIGRTRAYATFRKNVRAYYRTHYRLAPRANARAYFNPGQPKEGGLAYEPKIGAHVLEAMLAPYVATGRVRIFYGTRIARCQIQNSCVRLVETQREDGTRLLLQPRFLLDATATGEVLALCGKEGVDWVLGAEGRTETGEPDAPVTVHLDWIQPLTFPFAVDWSPQTRKTNIITPPGDYKAIKAAQHFRVCYGALTGFFKGSFPLWRYRRILAKANFSDPRVASDLILVNTPGNDAPSQALFSSDLKERERALCYARRVSRAFLYWLQTEAPREDDPRRRGYPEVRLRLDLFDTEDGLAPSPYVRESRRIRALSTVREQELIVHDASGHCLQPKSGSACRVDSVGVGFYPLDIHANGRGERALYLSTRPFHIPLGALIPVRLANLLPASKNLGVTHLANGAFRLHPVEWNVGESSGLLAAFCVAKQLTPREAAANPRYLHAFQTLLRNNGIPLDWTVNVTLAHPMRSRATRQERTNSHATL